MKNEVNNTLLTDFYEIAMANGYYETGRGDEIAYFDMFFRSVPDNGGFAIMAGVEQLMDYLENLKFTDEDIEFLRGKGFSEGYLEYLRNFEFACDVWAIPEGMPIFPQEPVITVRGPVIQAQFIETMLLLIINHQSLIATKANRIVRAAKGRPVMEFGTRRAHGISAARYGARAAFIGGCVGTACTVSDRDDGIPALGTMAHSWVQSFDDEYEAFRTFAELYPDNATLLVDTYNVLKSGVPNAIKVFKEVKPARMGIRIDSGDVTYLTRKAREMLDEAGLTECKIVVSNSLDEHLIEDIINEGACIDSFGVGERLITARSEPVFGGVYKMAAVEKNGRIEPKMKVSENVGKITNPGAKRVYRLYDNDTGKALADVIALADEGAPSGDGYVIFDEKATWKRKTLKNFHAEDIRIRLFDAGKRVYDSPDIREIQSYCRQQTESLWDETKRFENPQTYYVDLTPRLWELKQSLLSKLSL